MFRTNVRRPDSGFTMMETMLVMVMVAILAALGTPRLLGLYSRTRANQAMVQFRGALETAQKQAIRNSRSCLVRFDTTANSVQGTCLLSGARNTSNITLRSSVSTFKFDIKGSLTDSSNVPLTTPVTIVLSSPYTRSPKCLVLSAPLGVIRTGTYTGGSGTPTDTSCVP